MGEASFLTVTIPGTEQKITVAGTETVRIRKLRQESGIDSNVVEGEDIKKKRVVVAVQSFSILFLGFRLGSGFDNVFHILITI